MTISPVQMAEYRNTAYQWQLADEQAHARLLALNANLSVDLVRMEEASDSLRGVIEMQGKTIDELKLLSFNRTNPPNIG